VDGVQVVIQLSAKMLVIWKPQACIAHKLWWAAVGFGAPAHGYMDLSWGSRTIRHKTNLQLFNLPKCLTGNLEYVSLWA